MKKTLKRIAANLLALVLALTLIPAAATAEEADKSATIAGTSTITTLNPLLMDNTKIVKYATSLTFLPLVELNQDLEFVGQLAEEITTEDNRSFTIHLNPDATWSDGVPVTSADVLFTFLAWASPESGNTGLNVYAIEEIGRASCRERV